MCDQSAEQQRDGLSGRQELAMSTLRCRRGLPYGVKSLHSGEDREYHVRVGVPNRKFWLLIVEILSRDDRAEDLQEKIDDYLEFGIPHIWVVNPRSRRGYVHTPEGSYEAKDGILGTAASSIELPLSKVFPAPTGRQSAD